MGNADVIPRRIEARNYAVEETLRDGALIHIRAIQPGDKAQLLEHFAGLSAVARYFRFFGQKRELSNQDLICFTELDFDRHVGITAANALSVSPVTFARKPHHTQKSRWWYLTNTKERAWGRSYFGIWRT